MKNLSAALKFAPQPAPELKEAELRFFCKLIEDLAGISLKPGKHDLVKARLRSRLHHHGFESYEDYKHYLEDLPKNDPEWQSFINMLTTNKTDFFREPRHFEYLVETILPEWLKTSEKTLKIWSSASSTGEEAYTLAMVLDRHMPKDRDFKILATDIDTKVVKTGQNAVYPISKKNEIPPEYQGCLEFGKGEAKGWFRIKQHLKDKVVFKNHNLIDATIPGEEIFDLVLCRNVLIYFDKETIEFVSKKIYQTVKKSGYFFIGHSESLQGIPTDWKPTGPSVFKKAN